MKSKFGGEIGYWFLDDGAGTDFSISVLASEILLEGVVDLFQLAQKSFVGREFFQPSLAGKLEHANGIVIGPVPKLGIEMTEEATGGRLPGPPDVEANFAERLERGGKSRDYIIGLKVRHYGGHRDCVTKR